MAPKTTKKVNKSRKLKKPISSFSFDYDMKQVGFIIIGSSLAMFMMLSGLAMMPQSLSAHAALADTLATYVGSFDTGVKKNANDLVVVDNYAYMVTKENTGAGPELYIFDITNPSSPTLTGSLDIKAPVNAIYVDQNRAYLATSLTSAELEVVDVSTKTAPKLLGSFDAPGVYDGLSVYAVGDHAYLGTKNNTAPTGREFYVLDVHDPTNVTLAGSYEVGADVNTIVVTKDHAYLATANSNQEFMVLDVTTPSAITLLSSYNAPGSTTGRGLDYLQGNLYGVTDNNGGNPDFFIWSVTSTNTLNLLSSLDLTTNNTGVTVYGSRAFVSTTQAARGLTIVNTSSLSQPVVAGTYNTGDSANSVAAKDSLVYLATSNNQQELMIVSPGVNQEPVFHDVNGDGFITVACLGDSNTTNDPGFETLRTDWCTTFDAQVKQHYPNARTVNVAVAGTTAENIVFNNSSAYIQLADVLANDAPDVVVFAFGTNDTALQDSFNVNFHRQPLHIYMEPTTSAYEDLYAQTVAAGAVPFIATTPPIDGGDQTRNDYTLYLNNRLNNEIPREHLIDFYSSMIVPTDFITTGAHLNDSGQAKREAEAYHEIVN